MHAALGGLEWDDEFVLLGGSSQMPMIKSALQNRFPSKVIKEYKPSTARARFQPQAG